MNLDAKNADTDLINAMMLAGIDAARAKAWRAVDKIEAELRAIARNLDLTPEERSDADAARRAVDDAKFIAAYGCPELTLETAGNVFVCLNDADDREFGDWFDTAAESRTTRLSIIERAAYRSAMDASRPEPGGDPRTPLEAGPVMAHPMNAGLVAFLEPVEIYEAILNGEAEAIRDYESEMAEAASDDAHIRMESLREVFL